jgi:hypothetical protein
MSDSQNDKIDDIFIIPQVEKYLRGKSKAQLKKGELIEAAEETIKRHDAVDYTDPCIINAEEIEKYWDEQTDKKYI